MPDWAPLKNTGKAIYNKLIYWYFIFFKPSRKTIQVCRRVCLKTG